MGNAVLCEEARHAQTVLPQSLEMVWLSGDVVPAALPSSAQSLASHFLSIFAMGGATEAGIWSNSADVSNHQPGDGAVPYGHALPGQGMRVVRTDDLEGAAVDVPGMLVISGGSLMIGYYHDEAITSKALVEIDGEKLYLTQDAGYMRYGKHGALENMITGRIYGDGGGYVKVRGFRVELLEVEMVLSAHAAVQASAVATHKGDLIAYVVLRDGVPTDRASLERDLRNELDAALPVYAVPRWIEVLGEMPLSSNAKVDRSALPAPKVETDDQQIHDEAMTPLEAAVMASAQEVGIAVSNRRDDIFVSGADSVAALRLIFQLEAQHAVRLDVSKLFRDGRISSIAATVERQLAVNKVVPSAPVQSMRNSPLSLMTLSADESGLPLFLCHGAGTTALALSAVAAELQSKGAYGRIYGVSDKFLASASSTFDLKSIEHVATCMADLVMEMLQGDDGKEVALGGWSYGGVVAFACARDLEARGVSVRIVIMLDAPLGQKEGSKLDEDARGELAQFVSDDVASRVADHFESCNDLLKEYCPCHGSQLAGKVLDIRAADSRVDFLSNAERQPLAAIWHRVFVEGSTHWSLVRNEFAGQVAHFATTALRNQQGWVDMMWHSTHTLGNERLDLSCQ